MADILTATEIGIRMQESDRKLQQLRESVATPMIDAMVELLGQRLGIFSVYVGHVKMLKGKSALIFPCADPRFVMVQFIDRDFIINGMRVGEGVHKFYAYEWKEGGYE